jgi:hypothetical protein
VNDFASALAKVRPSIASDRKRKGHKTPDTSSAALLHDKRIAKTLPNKLCSLAQTRLLGIITDGQKLVREQAATILNHTQRHKCHSPSKRPLDPYPPENLYQPVQPSYETGNSRDWRHY